MYTYTRYAEQLAGGRVKTTAVSVSEISVANSPHNRRHGDVYESLLNAESLRNKGQVTNIENDTVKMSSTKPSSSLKHGGIELVKFAMKGIQMKKNKSISNNMTLIPHVWSFGTSSTGMLGTGQRDSYKHATPSVIEKLSGIKWGQFSARSIPDKMNMTPYKARSLVTDMLSKHDEKSLEILTFGSSYSHIVLGISYTANTKHMDDNMIQSGVYCWGTYIFLFLLCVCDVSNMCVTSHLSLSFFHYITHTHKYTHIHNTQVQEEMI